MSRVVDSAIHRAWRPGGTVGWAAHAAAVDRLRESYDAIPPGVPVRLAKRTTNLFRVRQDSTAPGLDVSGLTGVVAIDPEAGTVDVQGMCTYEDLVEVTLRVGAIPLVVPQLRTITLGGAVTGLGIEATSFRHGLPHESVLEMDVLTGGGDLVTVRPGDPLFDAFPNSYGSLGYATRLRIELEPVPGFVGLRHVLVEDRAVLARTIADVVAGGSYDARRVDAVDGVVFGPREAYLTLATWTEQPDGPTHDYTGPEPYYRSLQRRRTDALSIRDYLWRWDTDWFWCSRAFGVQHPLVRPLWPRRFRRSDVYQRLVGLDHRLGLVRRVDAARGRPGRERVIQDVEIPVDRLPEFLDWFDRAVGMSPVWLCPLRLREVPADDDASPRARRWPSYPLEPGTTYVNVGFWGTVPVAGGAEDGDVNRAVEQRVTDLGGHKSLYSDAYYDRATFDRLYGGEQHARVKQHHDPQHRLTDLYDKTVRRR